jgi:flagellar hook-basal body complex protein FliE
MSELRITGIGPPAANGLPSVGSRGKGVEFGESLRQALGQVSELQQAADSSIREFSLGQTRDVAGTLIAVEKANLGFQLALQIRNKLLEAYQEILRTPL